MSYLYKFIGNHPGDAATKNQEFYIEITDDEQKRISTFPYPKLMTATIVDPPSPKNNSMKWKAGDVHNNFCNPYYEMHNYGFPPVIRAAPKKK
jgi:hypothetical protein